MHLEYALRPRSRDAPPLDCVKLTPRQEEDIRQDQKDELVFMLEYIFNSHTPGLACLIFVLAEIYIHGATERMVKANMYLQAVQFAMQLIGIYGIREL